VIVLNESVFVAPDGCIEIALVKAFKEKAAIILVHAGRQN
jgi:hypothetical protein